MSDTKTALDELLDTERTRFRGHSQSCVSSVNDCDCGGVFANRARAELAALRERVAKLEAALVKADELGVAAISATWPDLGDVPTSSQEWCKRFLKVKDASATYRTAREATK